MKSVRPRKHLESEEKRESDATSRATGSVTASREKHTLVWGILRLILGVIQMAFAAAAMLRLIYTGLSRDALICAAVATIATLGSRVLFRGRRGLVDV